MTHTLTFFFSNYPVLSVVKNTRLTIGGLISTEEMSEQPSSKVNLVLCAPIPLFAYGLILHAF